MLQDILREFVTFIWNCEMLLNDVIAVILGFNDYDLVIVGVTTDARNELRKDIVDKWYLNKC